MFLHMATSAKSWEKSGAPINPGMPLSQGDLRRAALRLPSIEVFSSSGLCRTKMCKLKNNLLPDMVEERKVRVIGLLSSHTRRRNYQFTGERVYSEVLYFYRIGSKVSICPCRLSTSPACMLLMC